MKDILPQKSPLTQSPSSVASLPADRGSNDDLNGTPAPLCKIERSIVYMKEHLDEPLQVATLAALVNISPSHYYALFKRSTGSAPIDYFTRLRMGQACQLLSSTKLSVKEIASALGYEDPFYFSRVFKSVNGAPPSEYRLAVLNEAGSKPARAVAAGRREQPGAGAVNWNANSFANADRQNGWKNKPSLVSC